MTCLKQLWILAGGNGAGKSTFYRLFLAPHGIRLLNADQIALKLDPDHPENAGYKATRIAERLRDDLLNQGFSFCYETVFSHVSKIDFVARAKALSYEIILVYIHLETPDLNEARVMQRVTEGGHNVPAHKIRSRLPRTLENVSRTLPLVDEGRLLDNSSYETPFQQVAVIRNGRVKRFVTPLPEWAVNLTKNIA